MYTDTDAIIQSFRLFGYNFVLHVTTFAYEFATDVKPSYHVWLFVVIKAMYTG
jgi:hypothetical protein